MTESELKIYLQGLYSNKVILTEAAREGNVDYMILLGCVSLQITTTERIIVSKTKNLLDEN